MYPPPAQLSLTATVVGLVLFSMTGCSLADDETSGDDTLEEAETTQSSLVSECDPDEYYASCIEIDAQQTVTWQDTLPDPDWRTVEPSDNPELDYEIEIDVSELNGGIIPTAEGQGEYDTEAEFFAAYSSLIGIDVENNEFGLIVAGETVKQATDGGPSEGSTGVFVYDALTDEDGKLFVDNTDVTDQFVVPERQRDFEQEITRADGTTDSVDNDISAQLLNSDPVVVDDALLADGAWRANLQLAVKLIEDRPFITNPVEASTDIKDVSRAHRTPFGESWFGCLVRFEQDSDGQFNMIEVMCNSADSLYAQTFADLVHPDDDSSAWASNARSVSTSISTVDAALDNVCGFGNADFDSDHDDSDNVFFDSSNAGNCPVPFN